MRAARACSENIWKACGAFVSEVKHQGSLGRHLQHRLVKDAILSPTQLEPITGGDFNACVQASPQFLVEENGKKTGDRLGATCERESCSTATGLKRPVQAGQSSQSSGRRFRVRVLAPLLKSRGYGLPLVDSSQLEDVDPTLELVCLSGLVSQTPSFAVGSSCSAGVRLAGAGGS